MKAGQRYGEVTGNIWSYAQRGDTTGVKAALARGVDANACNIAGWTPSHAAASTSNAVARHCRRSTTKHAQRWLSSASSSSSRWRLARAR